jgi:DNA-binding transcriptional regulator YdaS (Cro superfamily)
MTDTIEHPLDRAARVIGSAAALARLLKITRGAVTQYKEPGRRIPAEHCPIIERETKARGEIVTCEVLRPDVDWSVLRQSALDLDRQEAA